MEVLVTLAIIGLAAGVVMPGLASSLNSASRHAARLTLEESVLQLRRAAMDQETTLRLGKVAPGRPGADAAEGRVELPAGWTWTVEPGVVFFADGTCSGGIVTLTGEQGQAGGQYVIRPPRCRPSK